MRFILTASAIITGSSALYFYICHQRLSTRIQHRSHRGTLTESSKPVEIESIPDSVFTDEYYVLYDRSTKAVLRCELPSSIPADQLFTTLVRRNMTAFSRFPQALMIRLLCGTEEEKQSFKASRISSLDFEKGDLVCGVYRVVGREKNKVEFEIKMKNLEFVDGRLAISFSEMKEDEEVVFSSETMMWRRADEKRSMPLEKSVLRWMHETAAWWLIDSGVKYLMDLEG